MLIGNWRGWKAAERALLLTGLTLVGAYGASRLYSEVASRNAVLVFEQAQATDPSGQPASAQVADGARVVDGVDVSLWSEKRIRAYHESLTTKEGAATGVLKIPRLHIEVPVFDGTDDLTLNRGVGRIIGTARIGVAGNTAIAGHRDGFFRGLKDIVKGDSIELVGPERTIHYVVEKTQIVIPDDVSVLADDGAPSLTLVTCFPFYFVGDAPQRFIVHAKSTDNYGPAISGSTSPIQTNQEEKEQ